MSETSARSMTERATRRCHDIVDAAAEVFLERGYAGTSMDAVVERAGGSKETLYCHFGSKAGLFKAIVEQRTGDVTANLDLPDVDDVGDFLRQIGIAYLQTVLSPRGLALYRLVLAESGRMPEMGDLFYRLGPETATGRLADGLAGRCSRQGIPLPRPNRAAALFLGMLRGDLQLRALFNPTRAPVASEITEHVDFVVEAFLKAIGT